MENLPALLQAFSGKKYHIAIQKTDKGYKTRCGRLITGSPEDYPIIGEYCPRCGSQADFDAINATRILERRAADQAHADLMDRIARTTKARNQARPDLVQEIVANLAGLIDPDTNAINQKHYPNEDELVIPVNFKGQEFTVKIAIWNGKHE